MTVLLKEWPIRVIQYLVSNITQKQAQVHMMLGTCSTDLLKKLMLLRERLLYLQLRARALFSSLNKVIMIEV